MIGVLCEDELLRYIICMRDKGIMLHYVMKWVFMCIRDEVVRVRGKVIIQCRM